MGPMNGDAQMNVRPSSGVESKGQGSIEFNLTRLQEEHLKLREMVGILEAKVQVVLQPNYTDNDVCAPRAEPGNSTVGNAIGDQVYFVEDLRNTLDTLINRIDL